LTDVPETSGVTSTIKRIIYLVSLVDSATCLVISLTKSVMLIEAFRNATGIDWRRLSLSKPGLPAYAFDKLRLRLPSRYTSVNSEIGLGHRFDQELPKWVERW
jgi:hypothetical protein